MSDLLKRILQQNWPFYSHRQLYDMVRTEAAGAGVLSDAERAWSEFAALMTDSRARIDELLREAGASWEGIAAESMAQGVTPLAQWADDAGAAGQASGSGLRQVGDSFSYTANAMPEPVRVTVTARYANVFSGQIDQDRQDRLAQEAKLRAVELMQRYSTDAHSAVSGLGVFVPPQEVTVRATPLQPPGGTAVQHGGNQIVTAAPGGARPRRETATQPDPGPASDESPAPDETPAAHSGGTLAPTTETATAGPGPVTTSSGAAAPMAPTAPAASVVPVGSNQRTTGGFPTGTGNSTGSRAARPEDRLPGRPAPRPGVGPVDGGRHDAGAARTQGARIAARTGAIGTGPTLAPAAATRREEDEEHVSPEYLRTVHKFWDVTPPASPPVIGDEDGAPPQAAPGS